MELGDRGEKTMKWTKDDDFISIPFRDLNDLIGAIHYQYHPTEELLRLYTRGRMTHDGAPLMNIEAVQPSFENRSEWTASTLSTHILSCQFCSQRVREFRLAEMRQARLSSMPIPWRNFREMIDVFARTTALRRSVTVGVIALILAGLLIAVYQPFVQQVPPTIRPPSDHNSSGEESGIG